MTTPNGIPRVGRDEPLKPTHSLPRYSEPTPETHRKVSREEEAELALKNTLFSNGARLVLIVAFLFTILSVPAIQLASEMQGPPGAGPVSHLQYLQGVSGLGKNQIGPKPNRSLATLAARVGTENCRKGP